MMGVILIIMIVLPSCRTIRERRVESAQRVAVRQMDSVERKAAETHKRDSATGYRTEEWSEEQKGVAGESTSVDLDVTDVRPGLDTVIQNTRSSVSVRVGGDKRLKITCKADSLLQVIRKYRRDSAWQAHKLDSVAAVSSTERTKGDSVVLRSSVVATDKVVRAGVPWWLWMLLGAVATWLVRVGFNKIMMWV